jgi:carbonic anhydrase/acetyltransferase-like protein (isoleucine patch superfamily)
MDMASIRAHMDSKTLIITKNSSYTRPINHRINLILGINARCMERVMVDGNMEMGKKAEITGSVMANNVVLGPGSIIYGDLTVAGNLMALDNAKVIGHVQVGGGAFIRPGVMFGSLEAGGLIEIQGRPPTKRIKGKMVVNDEMDYKEPAQQKGEHEAFKRPKPDDERVIQPAKAPAPVMIPEKDKAPAKGLPTMKGPTPKGKPQTTQKKPQNKAKKSAEEKPKSKGLFGFLKK